MLARRGQSVSAPARRHGDLDRGDFRPAIPRGEELSSRALQPSGRTGFLSPAAGESGEQLHPRQGPHDHAGILSEPPLRASRLGLGDEERHEGGRVPEPHHPRPRSARRSLSTLPRSRGGRRCPSQSGSPPVPRRMIPRRSSRARRASTPARRPREPDSGTICATGRSRSNTITDPPAFTCSRYRERLFFRSAILALFTWLC